MQYYLIMHNVPRDISGIICQYESIFATLLSDNDAVALNISINDCIRFKRMNCMEKILSTRYAAYKASSQLFAPGSSLVLLTLNHNIYMHNIDQILQI